ncbi:MAG: two-component system LytT family sensor kinase [Maribacter sp.]|jgi:two-component system LytT family sensor kinase
MRLKLLILFLFLFYHISYAQYDTLKVDSLKIELKKHTVLDTDKVNLLTDLSGEFNTLLSYEEMLPLGLEALALAKKIKYNKGIGMAHNSLSAYYTYKQAYSQSAEHSLSAIAAFEKENIAGREIMVSYSNLGIVYKYQGEFDKAINIYLNINKKIKDIPLGNIHMSTAYNLSNNYMMKKDFENTLKWSSSLLSYSEQLNSPRGKLYAYNILGDIYSARNQDPAKSLAYTRKGLEMLDSIQQRPEYYRLILLRANANFSQKNYKIALDDYNRLIWFHNELNDYEGNKEIYTVLFRLYSEIGEDDKAYEAQRLAQENASKSLKEENQQLISDLEVKYETEKITREKEVAEENARLNRNLLIVALASILLLLGFAYVFLKQQQLKKKAEIIGLELKETRGKLELERKLRDSELKALKAQMNPHFLFNAFNSIQEYIIMNKKELASDYLGKFADLMRIYLDHSRAKTILLEDEIKAADLYLQLEKIRFEDELDFNITISPKLDEDMMYIPPMLIQPFIENALKHGLFHKEGKKLLELDFDKKDGVLICSITDNGIGRKESASINKRRLKKHQSFATAATQNRIELLNIGREEDINFTILDLKDENGIALGTKVILSIPTK